MQLPFLMKKTEDLITSYTYVGDSVLEIFIPTINFKRSNGRTMISSRVGRLIDTVGVFYFFEGKDLYFSSLPVNIQFEFTSERQQKFFKLNNKIPPNNYTVFTLKKGDKFIYNDIYILNAKDTNGILNTFYQAYLPNNIAYEDIYEIFSNAFFATNMKFPAVSVLLEALISQLYRSKSSLYSPFRMSYNGRNSYSYKNINIKKVPEVSSLFSSLVGEDGYYQLTQILSNKDNVELTRKNAIETILDIQLEKE
jgi:hypothetical protein